MSRQPSGRATGDGAAGEGAAGEGATGDGARVDVRATVRTVAVVVGVLALLYLVYRLRTPLTWLGIAVLLAVALSRPVDRLARVMPRGLAIAAVFIALLAAVALVVGLFVPPLVTEAARLIGQAPAYAAQVRDVVAENERLRELEAQFQILPRLQEQAGALPERLGDAALIVSGLGFTIVNSIFAGVTILVLTAFLLGSGEGWMRALVALQPEDRGWRLERALHRMADATGGYVRGALAQAAVAGVAAYLMLWVLGVPFRAPLALLIALLDLIPLVGATIGALLVGVVTLFTVFPTGTIVWAIYSIVYQQVENYVIQPRIQQRAASLQPFLVFLAVLFGGTLLGVLGALIAIPVAACLQIVAREWWVWRREQHGEALPPPAARRLGWRG